jgi:hypothetical protein
MECRPRTPCIGQVQTTALMSENGRADRTSRVMVGGARRGRRLRQRVPRGRARRRRRRNPRRRRVPRNRFSRPLHLRFPVPRAKFCFYGTAGARMSVPGASIGQRRSRRIRSKSVVRSKVQRIMLGVILRATSNIRGSHMFSPDTTPKRPMLRPVLRATSNIMSPPPSSFTCLQHRNSSSARLKINICNIQHQGPSPLLLSTQYPISHVCDIETQHP